MGRGRFFGQTAIAIATVALGVSETSAQAVDSGSSLVTTLDLISRFEADSNRFLDTSSPGTTYEATETLRFGLMSETAVQSLDLTVSGALRFQEDPVDGSSFDFNEPTVDLSYTRRVSDSSVSVSANYRLSDVSDAADVDDLDPDDLAVGTGELAVYGASVNLQVGLSAPLGFSFDASWDERSYRDTTDPDLEDISRYSYGASANLRFSPVTRGSLSATRMHSSSDNAEATETEDTIYDFSLTHDLRRALVLTGSLGYAERDSTELGVLTSTNGLTGGINAVQTLKNGTVSAGLDFDNSDEENEVSVSVERSMALRDGSVTAGLTVTNGEDSGAVFLGTLDYSKSLPNGALSVGLRQSISTDSDDDEVKLSELNLSYSHSINSVSGLGLDLRVSRSEDGGMGSAIETNRADFIASYSHELTPDWDLTAGYRHRRFKEEGTSAATSDALFLTLSRSFDLRY